MASSTAAKMNEREQKMRNPRNSAVVGKKLVIAIGAAPTLKKPKIDNSKAAKLKK